MPSAAVLLPVVLPLAAAAAITALGAVRMDIGRAGSAGAWASLIALGAVWVPVRSTQELVLGSLGFGSAFDVRIDAVAFAFGLMIAAPVAVLLTFQRRTWQESAIAMLALSASMAAVEAGGIVLAAIAGGTAATLAVVLLDSEDPHSTRPGWAALLAGWLALAWVGVLLQVRSGTAVFEAVPVSAVTGPIFALLAGSAVVASGLFPWKAWPSRLWSRRSLSAAGVALATLYPLGLYLLVRGYELGDGRYPHPAFNLALGLAGIAVAFGAAFRAQAAATRRDYFAEVVPAFGGFALMSIAVGTGLGLVAGLIVLATAAALIACLSLLPDGARLPGLVAVAAAAGLPPGVAFGSRALGVEATFEGGDFLGLIGLGAMASWAIWVVASARAVGLAPDPEATHEGLPRVAGAIALGVILLGPALAAMAVAVGDPLATDVLRPGAVTLGTRLSVIDTTSTVLPAVSLFLPLLLIGALAYPGIGAAHLTPQPRPAVLRIRSPRWWRQARQIALAARVPEQYRSLLNPRELELAAGAGRPFLWLAALVALAFAVTR
ncbi:MAG TPA: hypothetical protein VEU76_09105 [Candidatus Udaeobacter sp.]|nr:hypothetical protein [Candidatus Udaeobacter sp.]